MRYFVRLAALLAVFFLPTGIKAADDIQAISQPQHRQILEAYKKNAEEFCSKNLNKFGLSQLWRYDAALDSLYKKEMADTVVAYRNNYDASHASRSASITDLNEQIKDLTASRDEAQSMYSGLLRKTIVAAVIWVGVVILLMQLRSRTLRRIQNRLDESKLQVESSDRLLSEGNLLLAHVQQKKTDYSSLTSKSDAIQEKVLAQPELTSGLSQPEADTFKADLSRILQSGQVVTKLSSTLLTQSAEAGTEKAAVNLNQLCDQCFDLVYYGLKGNTEENKVVVSKDLEKNLPPIKVVPEAISQLLINVVLNAFQSVRKKNETQPAGYIPKVTISTRILPRFLQVRVRDNGEGMPDALIQKSAEAFFTTRTDAHASGLGMHFVHKIVGEAHNGEIKIESEPGTSTDVYIKFFTS